MLGKRRFLAVLGVRRRPDPSMAAVSSATVNMRRLQAPSKSEVQHFRPGIEEDHQPKEVFKCTPRLSP